MTSVPWLKVLQVLPLLCGPGLSVIMPLLVKPPRAVLAHLSDEPNGIAAFNAQGMWGTITVGGRFSSSSDAPSWIEFSVVGQSTTTRRVPISGGDLVTYQMLPAGSNPHKLLIRGESEAGAGVLGLEGVAVRWTGSRGWWGRIHDSIVAWASPRGLAGRLYQAMLLTGIIVAVLPFRLLPGLPMVPWIWWIGSAALMVVAPAHFSPLTRLLLPGGVALSSLVFCGSVVGLVVSVATRSTGPRLAAVVLVVWGAIARLTAFPLTDDREPTDVDEIVYSGMAGNLLLGRGFVIPDEAYKSSKSNSGDPVRDSWWEHELYLGVARRGEPTASVPPAYPVMLAAFKALGLHDSRWIQGTHALLGVAVAAMVGLVALRLGGPPAGVGAMAMALFHSPGVAVTGFLFTEQLFLFLVVGACLLLLSDRPRLQLVSCALLGLAVLTRSVALALVPLWVVYMALTHRGRARGLALVGLGVLGLTLTPWGVYTHARVGKVVLGSTFAGKDLFMGNNDAVQHAGTAPSTDWFTLSRGHRGLLRLLGFTLWDMREIFEFPADIQNEAARDHELRRRAATFIAAHPGAFLSTTRHRVAAFVGFDPPPEPWEYVGQLPFLFAPALVLTVAAGGWSGRRRHRTVLVSAAVLLTIAPLVSIAYPRYRLPVDFMLFPLAGGGLARVVTSGIRRVQGLDVGP